MANPPANRRPGVDADIFQGTWLRGFDVPAGNNDPAANPCDLIISNGKSQIDETVSDLYIWNRTLDREQPMFIFAVGNDFTSLVAKFGVYAGVLPDPNGILTDEIGSLYLSNNPAALWQNQNGGDTWEKISDDLGGESLQETLAIGNVTGGFNLQVTNGDFIIGVENSTGGTGADVQVFGGPATGITGDGGQAVIVGGTSVGGNTGAVGVFSRDTTNAGVSGNVNVRTGTSLLGGNSGSIDMRTGNTGAPGILGVSGVFGFIGGDSLTTGALGVGGQLFARGGSATEDGQGGNMLLYAGHAVTVPPAPFIPVNAAGQGGNVLLQSGNSSGTRAGGLVVLTGGTGGSSGGVGGTIILDPGAGGGGAGDGEVVATKVLRADNIKRGDSDPNSVVSGNEGDVYQRTQGGIGQVWVNTNGSITGWKQLAFAGDLVEALQQMQNGYVSPSMMGFGGTDEELYSDVGLYKGLRTDESLGGTVDGSFVDSGPVLRFAVSESIGALNQRAGLDMITSGVMGPGVRLENRFFATFAFNTRSLDSNTCRFFLGLTGNTLAAQLGTDLPGGDYIGFMRSNLNANWLVVHRGGGAANFANTGIAKTTTDVDTDVYYFIVDATDGLTPLVRFFILDPDLNVISSITVNSDLPDVTATELWPAVGVQNVNGAGGGTSFLKMSHAGITTKAATVAQGGGTGTGGLTLGQVLLNGNQTDAILIEVNQGSGLLGVVDDNAGDGADVLVFGGATTLVGNDTGGVIVASGSAFGGGAEGAGATTGALVLTSGFQLVVTTLGDTGIVDIQSGDHAGTDGTTGDFFLRTGGFTNGAAGTRVQGDILIAAGSFIPNTATTTGEIIIKGGSSSLTGVDGGDVTIMSGENNSAIGDTGDIDIETFDANLDGDSGVLELATGTGGSNAGDSGFLTLATGAAIAGSSGAIGFGTGAAGNGAAGGILMLIGDSTVGNGSAIALFSGTTTDAAGFGGDIEFTPGTGPLGDGAVIINGKLTVTGAIDPTALLLDGQAVIPPEVVPTASQGTLWVDNTGATGQLIYTNSDGDNNISTGGGVTTLDALTDVTVTGPAAGEVLMLDGALQWVNAAGAGGSPLATILAIGNTTGAIPIVIEDSLGARLTSDGDLVLDPSVTPGDAVVIDGLRWPEADGAGGFVLTTNGIGQLSFQAPGGSSGLSFAESFTRMQWGSIQPSLGVVNSTGIFAPAFEIGSVLTTSDTVEGVRRNFSTAAIAADEAGVQGVGSGITIGSLPFVTIKFDGVTPDTGVRFFAGLTNDLTPLNTPTVQLNSALPARRYIGVQIYTDVPQTTLQFVTDDSTGAPLTFNTTISPAGLVGLTLTIDGTTAGQVTLTLYDSTGAQLSTTTFAANLPTATAALYPFCAAHTIDGIVKSSAMYVMQGVTRADLLNAAGGGGGNQDLTSVLGFGANTGGIPIQGDDNAGGGGGGLDLIAGSSTGGGGSGGDVTVLGGSPDPAGNGSGGSTFFTAADGAGTGIGGELIFNAGEGGVLGGNGGNIAFTPGAGPGAASADGGSFFVFGAPGGGTGGDGGRVGIVAGDALAGNFDGGPIEFSAGDASGTGIGGEFIFNAGDGGAGGGDGGSLTLTAGAGLGGGSDGVITLDGEVFITGKLNVTGMIDPPGLLMSSSGVIPFTPVGTEGGIWVNNAGELIFSNLGGDLNLSTAIGGGMTFLDALLTAQYGFLGPGNTFGGPQSYGVFGSSVNTAVSPGPPPASATIGQDSDGPFLNLAVAADAGGSEVFLGTLDLQIQRDSQFKARFKFQVTSPAHTDERIFIGYTDDATSTTPSPQLALDHPVPGLQYMALAQSLAGFNLEFVAQGSGGAMGAVFAIPTDALVHYFEIDASAASGDVTFRVYAADGVTIEAAHTELASFLLPDLSLPTRPFIGITNSTTTTTPRSLDFYDATVVTRADVVDAVTGGGSGGTSTLSAVLASGNTTGANGIEFSLLNTGITTETNAGGNGQDLLIAAGDAGAATSSGGVLELRGGLDTGAPGKPGSVSIKADSTASSGGTGAVDLLGGNIASAGGALLTVASGDPSGPRGGGIALQAGSGTGVNVPGGTISLNAGQSQGTEAGGDVSLSAATGGVGAGTGDGGRVVLASGIAAGTGGTGNIDLVVGSGTVPPVQLGNLNFISQPEGGDDLTSSVFTISGASSASGGGYFMRAGRADVGSTGDGGDIRLLTQDGDAGGDPGAIHLLADGATPAVVGGGDIQAVAKFTATTGEGGKLRLTAAAGGGVGSAFLSGGDADAASALPGGSASVLGGAGDTTGPGAPVLLMGGTGGATGDGGNARVAGGTATGGANVGGDVILSPGAGPGGSGVVDVDGPINPAGAGLQFSFGGSVGVSAVPGIIDPTLLVAGAPPISFVVPFNAAFLAAPQNVQVTLALFVPGPLASISYAITSITATDFTIVFDGAPPAGFGFTWDAKL